MASCCVPIKVMIIRLRNLYIYTQKIQVFAKQESVIMVWGRLRRPEDAEDAGTQSGVSRGLVPRGLRCPGTQSVCVRQDRG